MKIEAAQRIRELPPYLFARIDQLKAEAIKGGADLIDLGIGDPDLPTPPHIVDELCVAATEARHHRYPSYQGMLEFRQAAAAYYQKRFGVSLDPNREVLVLIGSKEGIAHFPLAFVDPGDTVLVPDPGYPVYAVGTRFVGGRVVTMPLRRERGFLPDLNAISSADAKAARAMWINYPNNPTAAVAPLSFLTEAVGWARKNNIIVASDLAYADVYFSEDARPRSVLEVDGARENSIEFYSLSKTFNMTGWRVGFAVGNADLIAGLGKVKTNVDSGVFEAVQRAALRALTGDFKCVDELRTIYRERRDVLCDGLSKAGFDVIRPDSTFYLLVANPKGLNSMEFAGRLLSEAHIVATPATGFGAAGEGFVRMTLCAPVARLKEAVDRMSRLKL